MTPDSGADPHREAHRARRLQIETGLGSFCEEALGGGQSHVCCAPTSDDDQTGRQRGACCDRDRHESAGRSGGRNRPARAACHPPGAESPARRSHLLAEHRDRVCAQGPPSLHLAPLADGCDPVQRAGGGARPALVGIHSRGVFHLRPQRCACRFSRLGAPVRRRRHHRDPDRGRRGASFRRRASRLREPAKSCGLHRHRGYSRPPPFRVRGGLRGRDGELLVLLARLVPFRGPRVPDAGAGDPHLHRRCARRPRETLSRARPRGLPDRRRVARNRRPRLCLAGSSRGEHSGAGVFAPAVPPVGGGTLRPGRRQCVPPDGRTLVDLRHRPGARAFCHEQSGRERALAAAVPRRDFPPADVPGGPDRGAACEGECAPRERGPVPLDGRHRSRAHPDVGPGQTLQLSQQDLARFHRADSPAGARQRLGGGRPPRRSRAMSRRLCQRLRRATGVHERVPVTKA